MVEAKVDMDNVLGHVEEDAVSPSMDATGKLSKGSLSPVVSPAGRSLLGSVAIADEDCKDSDRKALLDHAEDHTAADGRGCWLSGAVAFALTFSFLTAGALVAYHFGLVDAFASETVTFSSTFASRVGRLTRRSAAPVLEPPVPEVDPNCDETSWPGKDHVCGDCKVLISAASIRNSTRHNSTQHDDGHHQDHRAAQHHGHLVEERVLERIPRRLRAQSKEIITCHMYCDHLNRTCRAAWQVSHGGASACHAAAVEAKGDCDERVPQGFAVCECGRSFAEKHEHEEEKDSDKHGHAGKEEEKGSKKEHDKSTHHEAHGHHHALGKHHHHHANRSSKVHHNSSKNASEHNESNHTHHHNETKERKKDCLAVDDDTDYWTKSTLDHIGGVFSAESCRHHCNEAPECGAWTWGKMRNSFGLTDVCFLKVLDKKHTIDKKSKDGVVSGLRSDKKICVEDSDGALIVGVIKSRHGQCLEAADRSTNGGRVQMWTCIKGDPNQQWVMDSHTGQIKNQYGICLDAHERATEYSPLTMYECDIDNWNQQWVFYKDSGIIRNKQGICLDGAEPMIDGGDAYMRACDKDNWNQQWYVGPLDDLPVDHDKVAAKPGTSLYCFALMLPGSYEQGLLAMQYKHKISLFQCDEYAVLSNETIEIAGGLTSGIVNSSLHCTKGGEFGTALNLGIFLAVWDKVILDGVWEEHDWTIKVDPDAVFFADRLRLSIGVHPEDKNGVYLNNCKFGMHGPIEVFSRNAVKAWANGRQQCLDHFWSVCHGDCFWGEDLFVDQCLWKVLKVRRDNDYRLLVEDHCDPPDNWDNCEDADHVTFHPFKEEDQYLKCFKASSKSRPKMLH